MIKVDIPDFGYIREDGLCEILQPPNPPLDMKDESKNTEFRAYQYELRARQRLMMQAIRQVDLGEWTPGKTYTVAELTRIKNSYITLYQEHLKENK